MHTHKFESLVRLLLIPFIALTLLLTGCSSSNNNNNVSSFGITQDNNPDNNQDDSDNQDEDDDLNESPPEIQGRWVTGDLHVHTALSNDARSTLSDVLEKSFDHFDLDYVSLSNHMRNDSQDNDDNDVGGLLYHDALTTYELPGVAALRKEKYPSKLIYSSFEWDMPAHEHYNVGILWNDTNKEERLAAIREFEYRFSSKNDIDNFSEQERRAWIKKGVIRQNGTHRDAVAALAWLQENFPESSYGMLNHPLRYKSSYSIGDVRDLNNAAPDVFFLVEGMVGNQFNGNRGDYGNNSADGVHGGADPVIAKPGGWWDALLGEGRKIWNTANSDHHFKTRDPYASGYYPGEYAKNYTWVNSDEPLTSQLLLASLRSGNSFSVFGDIINALDFQAASSDSSVTMGQTLTVNKEEIVTITIRFKTPETNNRENTVNDENYQGINPGVHHIDLITGNVSAPAGYGSDDYEKDINESTHILKTFTAEDWHEGEDGYFVMSFNYTAKANQYFRLRGTNLDYNVDSLTVDGEPQRSVAISGQGTGYFEDLNQRNYNDLWFYSNPVFVNVN